MKLLYIIDGMFNSAGMERTIANKVNYLSQLGYEITILTTNQRNREYFYKIPNSVKKVDLNINFDEYVSYGITKRIYSYIQKNILFRKSLKEFIKNNQYDIIVTLMSRSVKHLCKLKNNSKVIYEHHFSYYFNEQLDMSLYRNLITKFIYKLRYRYLTFWFGKADKFIVLTEEDKSYWGDIYNNIMSIPNSISYLPCLRAPLENKNVIAIGRLDYQKGFDTLVEIWSKISTRFSDWKLDIYGDGPDRQKLIKQIDSLKLNESITIHPPQKDIENKLLNSSIFVLTSRFEGLPMVLLEALSVGVPSVVFDCKCGPKDVISDGVDGFICQQSNVELFVKKMETLMDDANLRIQMGKNAKQKGAKYSHENISKIWDRLFKELVR